VLANDGERCGDGVPGHLLKEKIAVELRVAGGPNRTQPGVGARRGFEAGAVAAVKRERFYEAPHRGRIRTGADPALQSADALARSASSSWENPLLVRASRRASANERIVSMSTD
jgi:hypothetical protein